MLTTTPTDPTNRLRLAELLSDVPDSLSVLELQSSRESRLRSSVSLAG
jgi:hypothetical protein